jgi:hypothetical protein
MRLVFRPRRAIILSAALGLAGCGFLPASQPEDFAVTGAPPSPAGTLFRSSDPDINAVQARGICADGYDKLGTSTLPTDSGTLEEWQLRCKEYSVSFLPSFGWLPF